MKTLTFATVVALLLLQAATAKKKQPEFNYDKTAKIVVHPEQRRDLLKDRSDVYYEDFPGGEHYACLPGDEHHAPYCDKLENWSIRTAIAYDEALLEDGTVLVIPMWDYGEQLTGVVPCGSDEGKKCSEPWDHTDKTKVLKIGSGLRQDILHVLESHANATSFRYAVDQAGEVHVDLCDLYSMESYFQRMQKIEDMYTDDRPASDKQKEKEIMDKMKADEQKRCPGR